ncbi:MAG TPA: penicillin-binding protein [Nocardioidaceae bacterium]|nr:penicillin-binding protein [Nocardioidaceae bacterium]
MSLPSSPNGERKIGRNLLTMATVSGICGVLVAGLVLPFASLVGITTQNVAEGFHDLPLELQETPPAQRSTVLDIHGKPIAYFYDENRHDISLDKVAPIMREALLAIEDTNFYEHGALDIKGTIRAFINNAAEENVQGGSSLTQQLVKMILLSQADTPKERLEITASDGMEGYARKIRELKYAMAYEESHTKDEIFEDYLNFAYFGDGAYGIDEAANHYFSVEPSQLKLKQAALLAGMVKNPSAYNPTQFPEAAADRRNTVLARMAQLDIISDEQAKSLYNTPLGMDLSYRSNGCVSTEAPFFCDYVQQWLLTEPYLGDTRDEREYRLETAGLTIKTTIDLRYQHAADNAVRNNVYPTDKAIGGLAMVEPGTGEVRALAQSRPMGRDEKAGQTYLDYVVPPKYGDANGFQAGSTFKVFVLATALKRGYPTSTEFYAPPVLTQPEGTYEYCNGYNAESWTVENSTDSGSMDMYTGTQLSVNTYYAQLEELVGVCPAAKMAEKMGIELPLSTDKGANNWVDNGPFTLGTADTNPLSMAAAYATFPARGKYCEPYPVTEILDRFGDVVRTVSPDCKRVFPRVVGDAVNDILRGVQETGFGADNGLTLNVPSAAKTGTISGNRAVWYMGYTEDLSTASMIAGANASGHWVTLNGKSVGGDVIEEAFGSTEAGPMWYNAMSVIQQWLKGKDFVPPDQSKLGGKVNIVPDTGGMSITDAKQLLRDHGFKPLVGSYQNSAYAEGTVAFTDPGAGSEAYKNQPITIYPSTGYVPPPEDNGDDDDGDNDNGGGNDGGDGGGPHDGGPDGGPGDGGAAANDGGGADGGPAANDGGTNDGGN